MKEKQSTALNNSIRRKVLIEDVILKDSNCIEPCLVQFSNGTVNQKFSNSITANMYQPQNKLKVAAAKCKRTLHVSTPDLYIGKDMQRECSSCPQEQLFLGVLDNNTGRANLIEMSSFLVHPYIKKVDNDERNSPSKADMSGYLDAAAEFGGKRARDKIRKRKLNEVDMDKMSEALNSAISSAVVNDNIGESETPESFDDLIPPRNTETSRISEVYTVSSIISDQHLLLFYDYAVDILEENVQCAELYSLLFTQTLANCKLIYEGEELVKYTCVNLYMDCLIYILKLKSRVLDISTFQSLCCPPPLLKHILNQFTTGKGLKRTKTSNLNDKIACYIIVLALIINDHEVPLDVLLQSLGIDKFRLEKLIKVVGATLVKHTTVCLRFPLSKLLFAQRKMPKRRK